MSDDPDGTFDPSDYHRSARERLGFLDAMLLAVERRDEVIDLEAESESAEEAKASGCWWRFAWLKAELVPPPGS